jgi:hypothetical protein
VLRPDPPHAEIFKACPCTDADEIYRLLCAAHSRSGDAIRPISGPDPPYGIPIEYAAMGVLHGLVTVNVVVMLTYLCYFSMKDLLI